ncbi:hypothetical protein CDN99_07675 [Roseateles aquatilis]|uniref:Uncharacterized protein n=1 Tax=Roseateles aquatilis TaxID=431061 RepID=A0A246JHX5_9BURK|nr:hypothetical protein [Roseateles aquatilis]OWQ92211.1 hypothetical protein CDN99_07675 [Roseateles aquatilis]
MSETSISLFTSENWDPLLDAHESGWRLALDAPGRRHLGEQEAVFVNALLRRAGNPMRMRCPAAESSEVPSHGDHPFRDTFSVGRLQALARGADPSAARSRDAAFAHLCELAMQVCRRPLHLSEEITTALMASARQYLHNETSRERRRWFASRDPVQSERREAARRMLDAAQSQQLRIHDFRARDALTHGDRTTRGDAMRAHALALRERFGSAAAAASSSEVSLIRDATGAVIYVVKPCGGESAQSWMPKGAGALREALAGAALAEIHRQGGIAFSSAHAEVVDIDGASALIQTGLPGRMLGPEAHFEAMDESADASSFRSMLAADQVSAFRIHPAELQRAVLAKLLIGDTDLKWANLLVQDDGRCHAIDLALGFPEPHAQALAMQRELSLDMLCRAPDGRTPLPAADQALDPALARAILAIDPSRYETTLLRERQALVSNTAAGLAKVSPAAHPDQRLSEDAVRIGVRGLRLVQELIRETPDQSLRALMARYQARRGELLPAGAPHAAREMDKEMLTWSAAERSDPLRMARSFERHLGGRTGLTIASKPADETPSPRLASVKHETVVRPTFLPAPAEKDWVVVERGPDVHEPLSNAAVDALLSRAMPRNPFKRKDRRLGALLVEFKALRALRGPAESQAARLALLGSIADLKVRTMDAVDKLGARDHAAIRAARDRLQALALIEVEVRARLA